MNIEAILKLVPIVDPSSKFLKIENVHESVGI